MTRSLSVFLIDEAASCQFGKQLAGAVVGGGVITLQGELGAGKTTLARSFVQALGHAGRVVSPTYTLMEPYALGERTLYHMDLYRLSDPEELEFLGIRDIDTASDLLLVEWPLRGGAVLPEADLAIQIEDAHPQGRQLTVAAHTTKSEAWLADLEAQLDAMT